GSPRIAIAEFAASVDEILQDQSRQENAATRWCPNRLGRSLDRVGIAMNARALEANQKAANSNRAAMRRVPGTRSPPDANRLRAMDFEVASASTSALDADRLFR